MLVGQRVGSGEVEEFAIALCGGRPEAFAFEGR